VHNLTIDNPAGLTKNHGNPTPNDLLRPLGIDGVVKSQKMVLSVIPAEAGIQGYQLVLDSGVRQNDGALNFLRSC
jgi:hypothetical protein